MPSTWEIEEIAPPEEAFLDSLVDHSAGDVTPEDGDAMAGDIVLPTGQESDRP